MRIAPCSPARVQGGTDKLAERRATSVGSSSCFVASVLPAQETSHTTAPRISAESNDLGAIRASLEWRGGITRTRNARRAADRSTTSLERKKTACAKREEPRRVLRSAVRARAADRGPRARLRELGADGQLGFGFRSRGGARSGAGRKPKGVRAGVSHARRPEHAARFPALVTTRLQTGLGSLRRPRELALIRTALSEASERSDFQVVHHSIQSNHVHLILEARDREALTAGMRGLLVRLARGLNRLWLRCGSVFADRFHARALRTPREVRNALVYVLQNARKHGIGMRGADPCSSGPWFEGWRLPSIVDAPSGCGCGSGRERHRGEDAVSGAERRALARSLDEREGPAHSRTRGSSGVVLRAAWTWLLRLGWKRHGLIAVGESPAPG